MNNSKSPYAPQPSGTILIAALWIIAILSVFAVSVGRQSAISLKITSYNADRLKAYFLARAGIIRAIAEKEAEYDSGFSTDIDALSESWASNPTLFDAHLFGDGSYTLSYIQDEEELNEEGPLLLYGLMDEQSKININFAPKETIADLLTYLDVDQNEAQEMAAAVIDWRDEDGEITFSEQESFVGAEDAYYQGISKPYHCKNMPFDSIYELILVRGFTAEVLDKLKDHITVYGDGRVNINTAGETVLNALFGPVFPNLASKVIRYRRGYDDITGTDDDRWFCIGPYVIDRENKGLNEIKNLQEAEWYANIYSISTEEYNKIKGLATGARPQISVSSNTYRARASAEVERVKTRIESVWVFEDEDRPPAITFWYQE